MAHRRQPLLAGTTLALLLGLVPMAVQAGDDVAHWLDRMARAVETLSYRGTLVHTRDGQVDTFRIVHRADEDGIRERLYSVDGEPREILRDGHNVRTLLVGDQSLVIQGGIGARLLPNLPPNRLSHPIVAYRMSFSGSDRIAGLPTRVLEIRPRDQFRYGHRFWLEENTGMLLRSALLDHRGNYLQQLSFVEIELGVPISDGELESALSDEQAREIEIDELVRGQQGSSGELHRATWVPKRLPDGFRLASTGRGYNSEGQALEHLLFSDGLASFSVYIEARAEADLLTSDRIEAIGPVHIYTGSVDDHQVTVVGEVPSATVAFVARQLQRQPAVSPAR
ncbi:MAG: hypothetical protein EA419_00980 [Wenzhouxiangella sp.]|nr:MAG: hypothetical protein EA419_00980 [Wenzhouxiangella sp.]